MATYCSIFAWRTPWPEEPGGLLSMGSQRVDTTEQLTLTNWNPLQPCAMSHNILYVTYYFIKN